MHVIRLEGNSFLVGEQVEVGVGVSIGPDTIIRANHCVLEDHVRIGAHNRFLVADHLHIGARTVLGDRNQLTGRAIHLGTYGYWESDIMVGQGGQYGPRSTLHTGPYTMVCDRVLLNLSDAITIGAWVGIGNEVNIWTHGAFLPVLEGFPADFGPVRIGDKVWLPARSTVLPNRTIGSNVVIGLGSLVNRDIPDGAFAAGSPIRILREHCYPVVDPATNVETIRAILRDYAELAQFKHLAVELDFHEAEQHIRCNHTVFDLGQMQVIGPLGPVEQDFRDYLRRRGIKFYNGDAFSSLLPPAFQRLLDIDLDGEGPAPP
jgi:acetyltransferase-like isoleucine patch superfamily enzyme